MPKRRQGVRNALLAALVLLPLVPAQAGAIPAFARKYKTTCALCHAPFPRLNAFGAMFAANGFQMARGEVPMDTLTTGDPLLRLQRDIPLAIRVEAYMSSLSGDDAIAADLKTPWGIKLLSGGQVTDDVSYYMYFFLTERGEVAGLEDAYLQFNDVLGTGVDLIAGQFQVSDPLFKRELRLEYEDYMPYRVRVGEVGADLTYERGLMAMTSPWKNSDLFVQVVNGRGLSQASEAKNYDTDNDKNVGVRFSQDLGALRVGGFYYGGRQRADGRESTLLVLGPDATVPLGDKVELNLQYMYRRDDNPFFLESCAQGDVRCDYGASDPLRTAVDAYMAEMIYSPQGAMGQWHFTGLYNRVDADRPVFSLRIGEAGLLQRYESVGVSAHYVKARNLRFMAEISQDVHLERTRFTTGVVTAF
ncbi:MAG TPA: hypothetical protein VJ997_11395 [Longimicrobiales bacterium]|nr:hypothetical protein [Longimicrobiales bacterium]